MKKQQASNGAAEQIAPSLVALAVNIRELHLDPKNVRRHPERNIEAIQASLRRFGQQAPVVYVVRDGRKIVIKGSGLLRAAQALGWKRLAAVRSDLAGDAAKAYAIADNRTTDLSEFDEELLAKQLEELEASDFDLEAVGFTDAEMAELSESLDEAAGGKDADGDGKKRVEFDASRRKKLSELYSVIVECKNEREQLTFYRRMQKEGRKCKLYML